MTFATLYDTLRLLRFTPLLVQVRLPAALTVQGFTGGALRGALGEGLGRALDTGVYRCPPMGGLGASPFERLWEPRLPEATARQLRLAPGHRAPPPYVVSAPGPGRYAEGALFSYTLVLVGGAAQALPLWIAACEHLAQRGRLFRVGAASGAPAQLAAVRDIDGRLLFDGDARTFTPGFYERGARQLRTDHALGSRLSTGTPCSLHLDFEAPARLTRRKAERQRLKREGTQGARLQLVDAFHQAHLGVLVERLYARLFRLTQLYCAETVEAYPGGAALPPVPDSRVAEQDTEFEAVTLSRQGRPQTLYGLTGRVTFAGRLAPLVPLFALGQHLHVGKSTAAGFGRFLLHTEEFSGASSD